MTCREVRNGLPILKIDLHVHTKYSDSSGSVRDILDAASQKGLDGIAITDHNTTKGWIEASKLETKLLVIPGVEVSTKEGHLLILGIQNPPPKGVDALTISDYARREGGVVIVPHIGISYFSIGEEVARKIKPDAVETHNAEVPFNYMIKRSVKIAEKLDLPQTGGSDSHSCKTVGNICTMIETEDKTVKGVIDAIRKGKVKPLWKTVTWTWKSKQVLTIGVRSLMFWRE